MVIDFKKSAKLLHCFLTLNDYNNNMEREELKLKFFSFFVFKNIIANWCKEHNWLLYQEILGQYQNSQPNYER